MSGLPIAIVGAGAAGLAAAASLRAAGRPVVLLEAGDRIGGRAHTVVSPLLGHAAYDTGATWLHQTDRNPLVELARAAGDALHPAHQGGRLLLVEGRTASDDEQAAYAAAESAWRAQGEGLAQGPDRPLSDVGDVWGANEPWLASLEMWDASLIAAVDADRLSLHDWAANQLDDNDLRPADGVGAVVARRLGPPAGAVRLGVTVRRIDWRQADRVRIETGSGTLEAAGCIVTVSTGVLRDGRIGFVPALPEPARGALDGLPMGLLSKAALPLSAAAASRLGLADGTLLEPRRVGRDAGAMLLHVRPDGIPALSCFVGGRQAWSHAGHEERTLDEARALLGRLLGQAAAAAPGPGGLVSRWGSDPLFLGAYAYARPGHSGARARLGIPFAGGRLVLAGEACRTDGLAGTVGGAILDGRRAAEVMAALD